MLFLPFFSTSFRGIKYIYRGVQSSPLTKTFHHSQRETNHQAVTPSPRPQPLITSNLPLSLCILYVSYKLNQYMICCEWPFSLSTASSGLIQVVACVSAARLTPFSAWVTPVMWVFPEFISHPSWALGLLAPLGCVDVLSGCGWTEACLNSASLLLALHRAVGRLGPAAVALSVLRPPRTSAQPLHFSCPQQCTAVSQHCCSQIFVACLQPS